jgi:hypothetical protein
MSLISLGIPTYDGSEEADFDLFVSHYLGHLGAVNVNPCDLAANPSGASRAMGILRGSLQGRAAEFFDRELAGKRWEIQYIHKNGIIANLAGLQGMVVPEGGALGPNAGTYVNPSPARAYSLVAGNALHTIGQAFIPTGLRFMDNEAWERSGGRPTNAPANELRNNVAGNGQPIVLNQITPDMALYWMSTRLPALLEEKRRMKFGNLTQGNLPIRDYYYKVDRASRLLNFPQEVRDNQFFRGLSSENVIEAERAGIGRPVSELVDIIERIEMRKDETRSSLYDRKDEHTRHRKIVEPVERPPVSSQEPITIKPVTSHAITQDMLNNLLQQHTKNITENLTNNFQTQIQALQDNKVTRPSAKVPPPVPPKNYEQMHSFYEGNPPSSFDYTQTEEERQNFFDWVASRDQPKVIKIAQRVAKKLAQAEERRQDRELARAMQDLNIGDHYPEPMDTSNLVRIGDSEVDADNLNVYSQLFLQRTSI